MGGLRLACWSFFSPLGPCGSTFSARFYHPCGFDILPNEINSHPERLWDARDGEIARCSGKFLDRVRTHVRP